MNLLRTPCKSALFKNRFLEQNRVIFFPTIMTKL
ncbi:hypothetical protein T01_7306 [Trichinella spiralis]|uniref:Uncharacterized protein n=1 Tax=Trichinella spiralis TaxID=6334 RepID=A0A0V0YV74_TRISP|nr:hypothetical protein T01_7306 [Trichinella spiralis]